MSAVRVVAVALSAVLLALTLTAMTVSNRPGPIPSTLPCRYTVTQGNTIVAVTPVERTINVFAFYDYRHRSAHTPFTEAYASVMFLYHDATKNRLYWVFHFNVAGGGSPDATTTLGLKGIPKGAFVLLSDDPFQAGKPEFSLFRYPQGQFRYFSTTDGGVLGPLPLSKNWTMKADFVHNGVDPMRTQKWVTGDSTRIPLGMTERIEIASVCDNEPPVAVAGGPYDGVEGSPIAFDASGSYDPDGDALWYTWDFEDDGVDDVTTTSPLAWHTYPDDFSGFARLTVSDGLDDDFALVSVSVVNHAPIVVLESISSPIAEGEPATLTFRVTDPGADWVDLSVDWGDGTSPETLAPVFSPWGLTVTATHPWGDDGVFDVVVTATDDDGGTARLEGVSGVVDNAAPLGDIVQVSRPAAFGLRIAGEKWHDVTATVFQDDRPIASMYVLRTPGSPDDQTAWSDVYDLTPGSRFTARVVYTPDDDPVNGQPWGASPAWILIAPPGEEPLRVHHTFNVRQPETHVWDVDLTSALARVGIEFEGFASDPGSDDLTFAWDFGDGGGAVRTYFNDGVGPDGPRSPGGTFPFAARDVVRHAFAGPGTYVVTLTVTDDDGGVSVTTLVLRLAG